MQLHLWRRLANHKRGVALAGRWTHSRAAFGGGELVGVLLTYERPAEPATDDTFGVCVYPFASFYLDGIAVRPEWRGRGIATALIRSWLYSTAASGLTIDSAPSAWSLQTNSAVWNAPVIELYARFGFTNIGNKRYENRTDVVMWSTAGPTEPLTRRRLTQSPADGDAAA